MARSTAQQHGISPLGLALLGVLCLVTACAAPLSVREGVVDSRKAQSIECVSVLPFENLTGEPLAGGLVAQEVASALLTSERFNVLAPSEAQQVLQLFDVPLLARSDAAVARKYGEVLGVQAVVIGVVTELDRENLTLRTAVSEPVVGFNARLVDAVTGQVIWSATASNFDYPYGLAVPQAPSTILHEMVGDAIRSLVATRRDSIARRGLCATAYAALEKNQRPTMASVAELRTLANVTTAPEVKRGAPVILAAGFTSASSSSSSSSSSPPSPQQSSLSSGPSAQALSRDGGSAAAAPSAPSAPLAAPGLATTPAPSPSTSLGNASAAALPALPSLDNDVGPAPVGDASASLAGPDLPPEPVAVPVGPPPKALLAKLKGPSRGLLTKMYRLGKPIVVATDLAAKGQAPAPLSAQTQKALGELVGVLKAAPDMQVRLDVHADAASAGATEAARRVFAQQQGKQLTEYVRKAGVAAEQISFQAYATSPQGKPKGAATNNRVELAVLRYPSSDNNAALPALPSLGSEAIPALPPLPGAPAGSNGSTGDSGAAAPGLPPLPAVGGEVGGGSAIPTLPDLPSDDSAAAHAGAGTPPKALLDKLGAGGKTLLRELYRPNGAVLGTDFPRQLARAPVLFPKSKKALSDLVTVLRAAPTMQVQIDVLVEASGPVTSDALATQRATAAARLITDYLTSVKAPMDRINISSSGRGKVVRAGAQANTRVAVKVVTYP